MKGDKCFYCENIIETDNEDELCDNCLSEFEDDVKTGRSILLAAGIVLIVVLLYSL